MNKTIKKLTALLFTTALCLTPSAPAALATQKEAEQLTCTATLPDGTNAVKLTDSSRTSKLTLQAGAEIKVSANAAVDFLYIVWDKPVKPYTITADGKSITCGESGFLHEYIDPVGAFDSFVLTVPEDGGILCDIYAFSAGTIPDWVQIWQPCEGPVDMLFVPTHGDDELLFFGGAIPYYTIERELRCAVAFFTHHWGEPYRPHEQLNAMWTAGLRLYPIFGEYTDIKWLSEKYARDNKLYESMLEGEVELLRRLKPQVIVGHDINGEYGHDTHMLNTKILREALEISPDAESYPESAEKYGEWDVPKTYLHLYKENPVYIEWSDIILEKLGGKSSFKLAQEAFAKYASQQSYKLSPTTPDSVYNCRKFGLYRTTVGTDTSCDDFMENVIPYALQNEPEETTVVTEAATDITTQAVTTPQTSPETTVQTDAPDESRSAAPTIRKVITLVLLAAAITAVIIIRKKQKGNSKNEQSK